MLFRPSFCANCGEKIERADWGPLTSRRFCQVCESEYKGQDLIPRVIVGIGVLASIFGFGSYLKSGSVPDARTLRQPGKIVEQPPPQIAASNGAAQRREVVSDPPIVSNSPSAPEVQSRPAITLQSEKRKAEVDEPTYYCGAETKKGTPCSRRVRGNTRCYQHAGMPAMASAEKLSTK